MNASAFQLRKPRAELSRATLAVMLAGFLALLSPITGLLCLCPASDPDWRCTCECAKCRHRRQAAAFAEHPEGGLQAAAGRACPGAACALAPPPAAAAAVQPAVTTEPGDCECQKHARELTKDPDQLFSAVPVPAPATDAVRLEPAASERQASLYYPFPEGRPG